MKLSIIVPCYNEEKTVAELLSRVERVAFEKEIIVIDDCSRDQTRQILKSRFNRPPYKLVFQPKNSGKGSAIREGLKHVSGDIVIIQDADLEYDPTDYVILTKPITDGVADVVYGSRWLNSHFHDLPFNIYRFATWLLTFLANLLYNAHITDEPTCYKVFNAGVLKSINLKCSRFEFCPEVTAKVRRLGYKIYEVPINYRPRSVAEGKKIGWKDGMEAVWTLLKYRFSQDSVKKE